MLTPSSIAAIAILVYTVLVFAGGFLIGDWRRGAEIEELKGENTLLSSFNDNCASDVANAKTAMDALMAATTKIEKQAAEMMKQAAPKVAKHTRVITQIKALPKVAPDMQCEAIMKEQIEYVQTRH